MNRNQKILAGVGAGALAVAAAVVYRSQPAPLAEIPFSTSPYTHNVTIGVTHYTGDWLVHGQQWGAYAINARTGGNFRMISPVENKSGGYQPATLTRCDGDFHQSMQQVFTSPTWVITTIDSLATHYGCTPMPNPSKVQVYMIGPNGLGYVGDLFANSFGDGSAIVGDIAYIDLGNGTWQSANLASCANMTCPPGPVVSSRPTYTPQTSIDGYTYEVAVIDSQHFKFVRQGGPTWTPTMIPSVPPVSTTPECVCVTVTNTPVFWSTSTPTVGVPPTRTPTSRYVRTPR